LTSSKDLRSLIKTLSPPAEIPGARHIPGNSLTTLDQVQQIDVIDGTDEFDPEVRRIKGGGRAPLQSFRQQNARGQKSE
jgi:hypothetical protein